MNFNQVQAVDRIIKYFQEEQWLGFLDDIRVGDTVRHAHIYIDSCLSPEDLGQIVEAYFQKMNLPIQRSLKHLPITPDMLNVYNIMPKGMCHFEFFLRYNPDTIIEPMPEKFSREHKNASTWDDRFMEKHYKQYAFKKITPEAEKDIRDYFWGDDFRYCYRMMIDEYRGLIHTHGLIETCYHPEELIPYAVESFREMNVEVQKAVSVVFCCAGKDIPKMVFLLGSPEVAVEIEWHYNPNVTIKAADPRFFRIADAGMYTKYLAARERLLLTKESISAVIASFDTDTSEVTI